MYQVKQSNTLATSFLALHSKNKHNYWTRSATQNLLNVPLARTNKYGKESVKYECIRDQNNFKKEFSQIPENKFSNMKIKKNSKTSYFRSILNVSFNTINFYMCTLHYLYFLSSRAIPLTPDFMILLLFIFIFEFMFILIKTLSC